MKLRILFLITLLFVVTLGCNKVNDIATTDNSQIETTSLKAHEIAFEGTSTPFGLPIDPGTFTLLPNGKFLIEGNIAEWYESADESMVTGQSIWYVNWLIESDWSGAEVWGTTDIYVGLESGGNPADADGKWELIWHGWLTDGVPGGGFFTEGIIEVEAVGTGTSGVVEGMTAHWIYTLDLSEGLIYNFEGSINSKPVTKTIKFQRSWGTFEFDGGSCCGSPFLQARIMGEGNASHIGHFTVLNTYCLNPPAFTEPIGPWLGFITAANGDEIHSQMMGFGFDSDIGPFYIYKIIGGTGRFDDATGEIHMWGETDFSTLTWYLEGEGEITY